MKTFLTQNKFYIGGLIIAVVAVMVLVTSLRSTDDHSALASVAGSGKTTVQVEVIDLSDRSAGSSVDASGEVESRSQATLSSEINSTVSNVLVEIGDHVSAGQVLVRFDSAVYRDQLAQAEAGLASQRARLESVQASYIETKDTQDDAIEDALEVFLNNDLQAYLDDPSITSGTSRSLQAPTISGTYDSDETGEYRISLYPSFTESGYSFSYSGLETGVGPVSTRVPQPLGSQGLFIIFPDNFARSELIEWVIPIPNTRSASYLTVKNRYEQTLDQFARNGSQLASIDAQVAGVKQAEAQVQSARTQLSKTSLRAPFSGTVTELNVKTGEQISPGQPVVAIVNEGSAQIKASISTRSAKLVKVGDPVTVEGGIRGTVTAISPALNQQTGKVDMIISLEDGTDLVVGEFVTVSIQTDTENTSSTITLPLSAIQTNSEGSSVFTVQEDGTVVSVAVETGDIVGNSIEIRSGLESVDRVITTARKVSEGDNVEIMN